MIDRGKYNVAGVRINAVDYEAVVSRVIECAQQRQPLAVSAMAVHGLMIGALDKTHQHRLNSFDVLTPDGQPVRWALNRLHGAALSDRVYGPTLMLEVCRRAAHEGMPVFLFGGSESLLADLRVGLRKHAPYLTIAGSRASKFRAISVEERTELVKEIRSSGARMVFVGLGCPRQEVFVYEMRQALSMPLLAVGAAFNFHAGQLSQAPPALQRCGLEWAYRLYKEPRRLWRRYLLGNSLYVGLLALQALGLYVIKPSSAQPPKQELRYG